MRVRLDEQLPRQLAPYLVGHDAVTVQQQGWAGLENAIEDLLPAVPDALVAIAAPRAGQVLRISARS